MQAGKEKWTLIKEDEPGITYQMIWENLNELSVISRTTTCPLCNLYHPHYYHDSFQMALSSVLNLVSAEKKLKILTKEIQTCTAATSLNKSTTAEVEAFTSHKRSRSPTKKRKIIKFADY